MAAIPHVAGVSGGWPRAAPTLGSRLRVRGGGPNLEGLDRHPLDSYRELSESLVNRWVVVNSPAVNGEVRAALRSHVGEARAHSRAMGVDGERQGSGAASFNRSVAPPAYAASVPPRARRADKERLGS